jgi:hypothetical protein
VRVGTRWRIVAASFVIIVAGCSSVTSFSGLSGSTTDGGADAASPQDASAIDGTIAADSAMPVPTDASDEDATRPCTQPTSLGFDGGLGAFTAFSTVNGYPNEESFFGDDALVLIPFRDTSLKDAGPDADAQPGDPEILDSHSGLFYSTPVPLSAFDVSFDAKVVCTSGSSCADGLIFTWLDLQSTAALTNKSGGSAAGLPDFTGGSLFNIDDYKNDPSEQNDPYAPSLQIDVLDKTKAVGGYAWQQAITKTTVIGDWHSYTLTLRAAEVKVTVDGVLTLDTPVPALMSGIVGFTSGTGGESDAVAIRHFRSTFYDCQP